MTSTEPPPRNTAQDEGSGSFGVSSAVGEPQFDSTVPENEGPEEEGMIPVSSKRSFVERHWVWFVASFGAILVTSIVLAVVKIPRNGNENPEEPPEAQSMNPTQPPSMPLTPSPGAPATRWSLMGSAVAGFYSTGRVVALSFDGSLLAVSTPFQVANGMSQAGYVKTYAFTSGGWVQKAQQLSGSVEEDRFGVSVSLSSSGDVIAIGAPEANRNGFESGYVRVFDLVNETVWQQRGGDIEGSLRDGLGQDVSLSGDGKVLAVGAGGGAYASVLRFQNREWIGQNITGDYSFGSSVSLSDNGSVLAIGAGWYDGNGSLNIGRVDCLYFDGSEWLQHSHPLDGPAPDDRFGGSISLSGDASTLAVGSVDGKNNRVRIFRFAKIEGKESPGEWIPTRDVAGEQEAAGFGISISMAYDGSVLAIGSPWSDERGSKSGSVFILTVESGDLVKIDSGSSRGEAIGLDVAISGNGQVVAFGSLDDYAKAFEELAFATTSSPSASPTFVCGPSESEAKIGIRTDLFPDQTSFELASDAGEVIWSNANEGELQKLRDYRFATCLDDSGCYNFTLHDSRGNGICCTWGDGLFSITYDDIVLASGGDFDYAHEVEFGSGCRAPTSSPGPTSLPWAYPTFVPTSLPG